MTGQEYLKDIRAKLESGRRQNRTGQNVLHAFGYVRRRTTVIEEINEALGEIGLVADPPISTEMPLKSPRIRFSLFEATSEAPNGPDALDSNRLDIPFQEEEDDDSDLPEPAFTASELDPAKSDIAWVPPGALIKEAYTKMRVDKYSQLVVAGNANPMQQDIKGIVSFQSIATALMNGKPTSVGDCIDENVPIVQGNADLNAIIGHLTENDVVLVIGQNRRLQRIVTAWDLAKEFTNLVDPFRRIGEIENRLGTLVRKRLGRQKVAEFLRDDGISGDDPIPEINELTMGELQRVLEFPDHWDALELAFDRRVFIKVLDDIRNYRNRLMHFGDSLDEAEMTRLTNFCHMVREIQL